MELSTSHYFLTDTRNVEEVGLWEQERVNMLKIVDN